MQQSDQKAKLSSVELGFGVFPGHTLWLKPVTAISTQETAMVFGLYYSSNKAMATKWALKHGGEECTYASTISQVKDTCKVLHLGWDNRMQP